jgi:hypothetical protein
LGPKDSQNRISVDRIERRRKIFERTVAQYAAAGIRIDGDPDYMALITLWISGDLDMRAAAEQFDTIRHRRATAGKVAMNPPLTDSDVAGVPQDELLRQISELSANIRSDT